MISDTSLLSSTNLWGFYLSASSFQFMLEGVPFSLSISTFFCSSVRPDNELFTYIQLSEVSRHTLIFITNRRTDWKPASFAGSMFDNPCRAEGCQYKPQAGMEFLLGVPDSGQVQWCDASYLKVDSKNHQSLDTKNIVSSFEANHTKLPL